MKLLDYLKDKILSLIMFLVVMSIILFLLISLNSSVLLIIYIPFILVVAYLFILLNDYFKRRKFYKEMDKILKQIDKKYLINEIINNPTFLDAEIFLNYLYEINKNFIERLNNYKYNIEDFKDYIELWCHEIKTPIATIKLIIDNNYSKENESILEELNKIEGFVEQVLYYYRSENVEKDYIVKKTNLKEIIQNVIKRNKKDLIGKKIKINFDNIDTFVESDSKWLGFIINQIIINSIKYSKNNPQISINYQVNENNTILFIEDNGIGIKEEEISRVFNKCFTGSNGRGNVSTGMGLYLCKKLCDKLGHSINVISKENIFTRVVIIFPRNSLTTNVTKV